jgi:hypothetical protein
MFIAVNPLDLIRPQFVPAPPFGRLKLSRTEVVGAHIDATTAVGLEATGPALPAVFDPVTWTTIVEPTSLLVSVYVGWVALAIGWQFESLTSHCCH